MSGGNIGNFIIVTSAILGLYEDKDNSDGNGNGNGNGNRKG